MKKLLVFATFILCSLLSCGKQTETIDNLQTEHLQNPIGIDCASPRLSWQMTGNRHGASQTAYQIRIHTDSSELLAGKADVWNTEKIKSSDILTAYQGVALKSFTRYYWQVTAWNDKGKQLTSPVNSFETAMMSPADWKGQWITDGKDINYRPAPYYRKQISVNKPIKSARAYISAAGLYELTVNGQKIGDRMLDPMYTRFDRRNLYATLDITSALQQGDNAVGITLGNGWYNHQPLAVWNFHNAPWRDRPRFITDIRIEYSDGTSETIATDGTWKTTNSPIISNNIYTAEHYDARKQITGWDKPAFNDTNWANAVITQAPSPKLQSQQMQPIRNVMAITAKTVKKLDDTTYLFDFEQNMSGVTKITLSGDEGTVVRLKHTERLHANGYADMSNIDVYYRPIDNSDPFQTDIIILSGKGQDEFMPKFNYKGFRYVEVSSSKPIDINTNNITAYFMHSDVAPTGKINSSDDIINKLWVATNNAYLSNLMGYPTDCPQREKNGWTGDGHFAIETALYNYNGITVYEKWLADHRDEQRPDGVLPDIIPTGGWGYGTANGVDWTSTIAIIPWNIYMFYGDSRLLNECYENIKRYVNYIESISPENLTSFGRGDWVPVKSHSSLELTSSCYYYVDACILAKAAKMFNKTDDYNRYTALAEKIKNAINAKYLNAETGIYASGTQTELSVPLQWGVVPQQSIGKVVKNLAKKVEEAGFHLDVGVLGAKAILNALSENGEAETAYKIAAQDTYPSWGWWVVNGATTLLENWDLDAKRDISDNHMMFGEIGAWMYKGLGGIFPDENEPGFKHIILKPNFVGLNRFEAKHKSPYGEIVSNWSRNNGKVTYTVTIPANSHATLYLPEQTTLYTIKPTATETAKNTIQLVAGTYTCTIE